MNISRQAILLLSVALYSCNSDNKKQKEVPESIPVISLTAADTVLSRNYVADIQAVKNVEVRSRVSGFLNKILVDEGQRVTKGQPLFQIDPAEFKIDLQKAQANVASARAEAKIASVELQRVNGMVDKKIISATELDLAKAKLQAAQAAVSQAQALADEAAARLSYTSIRAPFDGVIDRIPLKQGSLITDGSLLTTISDNSNVYAYFNVSENEYLRQQQETGVLRKDYEVDLVLSDGTQYPYKGKIETQEGEFNSSTGSIAFRARFPNPAHTLKHGASGKVHIVADLDNVVLVPQRSVFEIQDRYYVFTVGAGNKVKMQSFDPRSRIGQHYIVGSGLKAGDRIVYEGVQNIQDGAEITPRSPTAAKNTVTIR